MKNLIKVSTSLTLLFVILAINPSMAQNKSTMFEVSVMDSQTSEYFRGNAHIIVNHEEDWWGIKSLKDAVKKSNSLTLQTSDNKLINAFKPSSTLSSVQIKRDGKSLKLQEVIVDSISSSSNVTNIKLKYKSIK